MKKSRSIRLVLIGGLTAGVASGCNPVGNAPAAIVAGNVYTNNFHVPGSGYYHAPFRAWYPIPYNQFDASKQQYYFGGTWSATPHQSITNISGPTAEAAQRAQSARTDIQRSGFGRTSGSHHIWS